MLDVICGDRCGDRARCALKGWKQCMYAEAFKWVLEDHPYVGTEYLSISLLSHLSLNLSDELRRPRAPFFTMAAPHAELVASMLCARPPA